MCAGGTIKGTQQGRGYAFRAGVYTRIPGQHLRIGRGGGEAKGCKEAAVESINFHHHCRQSTGSCARILLLDGWMISDAYVHLCVLARAHTFILRLRQHERGTTHTRLHASRACLANRFVSIYLSTPPVLFVERDRQRERERMCVCVCLRGMCVVCTSSHSCTPPT